MCHHQVRWFGNAHCSDACLVWWGLAHVVQYRSVDVGQGPSAAVWGRLSSHARLPQPTGSFALAATQPTPNKSWPEFSLVKACILVWPGGPDPHICLDANPISASCSTVDVAMELTAFNSCRHDRKHNSSATLVTGHF